MSDKFFDKDNNFILWKDKGDLTKASKYVGDNRISIGVGESLVTKIAKGKVDIGREFGWMNKPLTVNWGVGQGGVVTYNAGEGLWIPRDFLLTAFDTGGEIITSNLPSGDDIGYVGYLGDTDGSPNVLVYLLPKTIGKYLYENAESLPTKEYYGEDSAQNAKRAYKGIAMYPNTVTSTNGWTSSISWGIGIRQRWDVTIEGHKNNGDFSYTPKSNIYGTLKDEEYYLVSQSFNSTENSLKGQLSIFNQNDIGSDHMWLRYFSTMTQRPHWSEGATSWTTETDDPTNVGAKYIYKEYSVIEKALTVNWGKCGGEATDTIVTYNEGDPLWIPKLFLTNGDRLLYNSSNFNYGLLYWKLPKEIGKYLYEVAESNTTDIDDYTDGDTTHSTNALYHNYKGIAIYSDNPSAWEDSDNWGVGIRRKSDIGVQGHIDGVPNKCANATAMETDSRLTDDDYYLVLQDYSYGASTILQNCSATTVDNGTPSSDHIYLRKYRSMTSAPSATNKGEKYTTPSELCNKDLTIYTETKDSITANWGKCGGTEDIIVKYNVGDPIWVPKAFFTQAPMRTSTSGVNSTIPDIGYIGKFAYSYPSESSKYVGIVYRLPQNLGELLYNNSESGDAYGNYIASSRYYGALWNGIAIYPDNPSSWGDYSNGWGVAIRKGSEIGIMKKLSDGSIPTMYTYDITSEPFYQYINTNDYYLVAEDYNSANNKYAISGMLDLFGDNTIYFRHWKTMSSTPSADNKGEKYTVTLDMVTTYHSLPTPNEDQVVIDWGGGIKTYYKYGEPMYIPRAFLMEAFDGVDSSNKAIHRPDNIGNHVGYQYWGGSSIVVYRLPDEIGEYLYNCAESWAVGENLAYNCTGTELGHMADGRLYKGIAMYPDESHNLSYSFTFGIGIRKKNDIIVSGFNADGTQKTYAYGNSLLDDDAYYLVAQSNTADSSTSYYQLYSHLSNCFPKEEVLWLRHWKGMTAIPNGTTVMGKKMVYHPEHGKSALGGKIFYIDPSDNGATYTFYDEDFNEVTGWSTFSDLANAKYYTVEGTPSKDKFYAYYPTRFDSLKWWNNVTTTIGANGTAIGTGKTNTNTVMSRTDIPTGSIWSKLSEIRTSSGIDDWFIPSKGEVDKFREVDLESWARQGNDPSLWASSDISFQNAWDWSCSGQRWWDSGKTSSFSVFFTRSF